MLRPVVRRQAVGHLCRVFECSERRACSALGVCRSMVRYESQRVVAPELLQGTDMEECPSRGLRAI